MGEVEEYDPFEEPDEQDDETEARAASSATSSAAVTAAATGDGEHTAGAGSRGEGAAADKIVMKLDAGKKKAKVAAVFDVGHALRIS